MNLGQLLALTKNRLDEEASNLLWSDATLISFLNAAQEQAILRSHCFEASIQLAVGDGEIDLPVPAEVVMVRDAWYRGEMTHSNPNIARLLRWSSAQMAAYAPALTSTTLAMPVAFTTTNSTRLRLYPAPIAGMLTLEVVRTPYEYEQMALSTDEPIIPIHLHRDLVFYAIYEAYSSRDADKSATQLADRALIRFLQTFGPQVSYANLTMAREYGVDLTINRQKFGA